MAICLIVLQTTKIEKEREREREREKDTEREREIGKKGGVMIKLIQSFPLTIKLINANVCLHKF